MWASASPKHLRSIDAQAVNFRHWQDASWPKFKAMPQIKSQHHFRFTHAEPWKPSYCTVKTDWKQCDLLSTDEARAYATAMTWDALVGYGDTPLTAPRHWYLYKEVREYCKEINRETFPWTMPTMPYQPYISDGKKWANQVLSPTQVAQKREAFAEEEALVPGEEAAVGGAGGVTTKGTCMLGVLSCCDWHTPVTVCTYVYRPQTRGSACGRSQCSCSSRSTE